MTMITRLDAHFIPQGLAMMQTGIYLYFLLLLRMACRVRAIIVPACFFGKHFLTQ
ncbi:hypothetical protein NTE_00371 [Candidatus Nitrososphaera evergladensis SR1]|uniref:Uncharacterized protein n=1 Tax=Candidatus Nitrososphaera evergladensis SR1 TaxID=1459636 RepID=A0A075MMH7_9ARCH|nr:hypothetical protein NTE_00371 [Candidatus Nitrososphaera evergladensis SR1]